MSDLVLYRVTIPGDFANALGQLARSPDHPRAWSGFSRADARRSLQLVLDRARPGDLVTLGLDQLGLHALDYACVSLSTRDPRGDHNVHRADTLSRQLAPHLDPNPVDLLARLDRPLDIELVRSAHSPITPP